MSLHHLDQIQGLVHQVSGPISAEPVIYLPGVHGDWTQMSEARPHLAEKLRLVEATYPRVSHWRLADFARALEDLMDVLEIPSAHIIGESFGSLVGWEFGLANPKRVRSFVLIGGFCQPPVPARVALARWGLRALPSAIFERGIDAYLALQERRGQPREAPVEDTLPYICTRTERGRLATCNRLGIIQSTDFRPHLHRVRFPVSYLGGSRDLVVPVRRELRTLREELHPDVPFEGEIIAGLPHAMLISHPRQTSQRILKWVGQFEGPQPGDLSSPSLPRP